MRKWLLLLIVGVPLTLHAQYCGFTVAWDVEPITQVQFVTINNTTSGTVNGTPSLEDFTGISADVVPGSGYPITVSGNTAGNWVNYIRVYIDWNGNQNFSDPGESYDIGTITNCTNCSVSGTITVPAAPPVTTTRMRVVKNYEQYGAPCEANTSWAGGGYGQAEDYTININAAPCAGVPAGGTANASVASACPSVNFSINVSGAATGTGLTYQWQSSPDGLVWTDIFGATGASYSGSLTATTNYRRQIVCDAGPDTAYSTTATVTLESFLNCYCNASTVSTLFEKISNVTFNTINNNSSSTAGYENFTSLSTDVFTGLSYPISVTVAGAWEPDEVLAWIDYNQDGIFQDPQERVFFATGFCPACTGTTNPVLNGTVDIPATAAQGLTRMRIRLHDNSFNANSTPCGNAEYGQVEDYLVNILPPPADEAGVLAITTPGIAACNLGQQIWVNLQNLGTNPLTSAEFDVKVNGISIGVNNPWNGNIPPQSTAEIQIPVSYALADGDSVQVEVSLPNGQTESPLFAFNNQVGRRLYAGLSGNKTVYGTGADYADVNAALTDLYLRGVCDTVFFRIASGTYGSQHIFLPYPEAGAGKLAVFESASGIASDVLFVDSNTVAADNYIFRFNGGDRYMLRNLTGIAKGTGFSKVVDILGGADDLIFEGNTFIGDTAAAYNTGDFERIVVGSTLGTNDLRTTLRNNTILGGNRAINLGGAAGSYEPGHVIEGNTVGKYGYIGAIFGNISGVTVRSNTFTPRTNLTQDVYSLYATGTIDGAIISGNTFESGRTGGGIFLNNTKGGAQTVALSNNFVYMGDSNATAVSRGITVQDVNSSDIEIMNNSISVSSDNAGSAGIAIVDGSQVRLYNNNVGAFGTSPALRVEKTYSLTASDNNNFFGTNLANVLGTIHTTLSSLQSATGFDGNSVSVDPGFSGSDLHTCTPDLNGAGQPLDAVTVDVDGDLRGTSPDIGADEFLGDANSLLVDDEYLKCPADQVTLGNTALNGVTYTWVPSGSTSEITTSAAGTYVVTATSVCGSFSDTAVVTNKPLPTASFTSVSVGLAGIFDNNSTDATTYLWDFGDGATSTEENPSHVYASTGTYTVTLTASNDCGSATFGPVPVNVINAGLSEHEGMSASLFPNPTDGQSTVTLAGLSAEATVISVIDVTGKTVMVKNIPAGVNQTTLDATTLASGVYSVKISNGEFTKVIRLIRK